MASCSEVARPQSTASAMGAAAATAAGERRRPGRDRRPARRSTPAWIFSHTRGTPNTMLGRTSRQVRRRSGRVGAGGDLEADEGLLVVAGHALGDVGHGQVRDQPLAGQAIQVEAAPQALHRPGDVVVGDHHALGRTGGARGVDHGGQVVGRAAGRGRLARSAGSAASRSSTRKTSSDTSPSGSRDDAEVLERGQLGAHLREAVEEALVLDHADAGPAVAGQVGAPARPTTSCRSRSAVAPQNDGGQVEHVELGDVAHHQHHPVARAQTRAPGSRPRPGPPGRRTRRRSTIATPRRPASAGRRSEPWAATVSRKAEGMVRPAATSSISSAAHGPRCSPSSTVAP